MLVIFANCDNSATGVDQKLEGRTVTLISPKADSVQSTSLTFQWRASENFDSFHFKLSGSKDFSSIIISNIVDSTSLAVQDLPLDSMLYWKVRPVIEGSEIDWSDIWKITITPNRDTGSSELPAPVLLSPKDEATEMVVNPTFKWEAVKGAESYIIHVDIAGEGTLITEQVSSNTFTPTNKLPADTTIYWRVHAVKNDVDGKWSDIITFTTGMQSNPEPVNLPAPVLLSPKDGAPDVVVNPTFKWEAVKGADSYIIHIDTAGEGTLIKEQVSSNTLTLTNKLPAETTIYWRVHAVKNGVDGKWSDIITFTTESTTTTRVTLVSPKDGADVSTRSVLLKWEALQGINIYRVQVARQNYFSTPVVNKTVGKTSYQTSGLDDGRTYYWRIQAVNDRNSSNWSATYRFTINVQGKPNSSDRAALMDLYRATNGDNWANNSGWGSSDPLATWYGIDTNVHGRVTRIDLWHNNLTGKIENVPWEVLDKVKYLNIKYNHLTGQIPPQIGGMESLRVLILQGRTSESYGGRILKEPPALDSGNWTHGYHQGKYYSNTNNFHGRIPATLGNLSNLVVLEISHAPQMIGPIPPEIGNLYNLKGLYLSGVNFEGYTIPDSFCKLTSLKHLYIEGAGLAGDLPTCFENLTQLAIIAFGYFDSPYNMNVPENGLTGPLPDFSQFTNLARLKLSGNKLTGDFPQYFNNGNFTQLHILMLAGNELTGTLPGFSNLQNLYAFNVNGNQMTGSIESLTELPNKIKIIGIGWNNFSGDFPQSGWPEFFQLKLLHMNSNQLTGSIPCSFWEKASNPALDDVNVGHNNFSYICPSKYY